MLALFVGMIFAPALAVTAYAMISAKEGYEDQFGFHAVSSSLPQALEQTHESENGPGVPLRDVRGCGLSRI